MMGFPIVVADDDPSMLRLLEGHLTRSGFTVFTCADGDEALLLVQRHKPVILLADWQMPGLTGPELCQRTHDPEFDAQVFAILVTGSSQPEEIAAGLDAGADDYLVKPVHATVLLARVRAGNRVLQLWTRQLKHTRDLESEIVKRKQAEATLQGAREQADASAVRAEQALADMERMNAMMMGREERVLEMKQEVNDLLAQFGKTRKYKHV